VLMSLFNYISPFSEEVCTNEATRFVHSKAKRYGDWSSHGLLQVTIRDGDI
jgi:hypothetical protein